MLAAPKKVVHISLQGPRCSTLALCEALFSKGWKNKMKVCVHDEAVPDERFFDAREAVRMKSYYQVLLSLPSAFRFSKQIPSNQPISYYRCILAEKPVEAGWGDQAYKAILSGKQPQEREQQLQDMDDSENAFAAGGDSPPRKRARTRKNQVGPQAQPPASVPLRQPAGNPPAVTPAVTPAAASLPSSSSSAAGPVKPGESTTVASASLPVPPTQPQVDAQASESVGAQPVLDPTSQQLEGADHGDRAGRSFRGSLGVNSMGAWVEKRVGVLIVFNCRQLDANWALTVANWALIAASWARIVANWALIVAKPEKGNKKT